MKKMDKEKFSFKSLLNKHNYNKYIRSGLIISTLALIAILIISIFVPNLLIKLIGLIICLIIAIIGVVLNLIGESILKKDNNK